MRVLTLSRRLPDRVPRPLPILAGALVLTVGSLSAQAEEPQGRKEC